jgi:hypothetical protein
MIHREALNNQSVAQASLSNFDNTSGASAWVFEVNGK